MKLKKKAPLSRKVTAKKPSPRKTPAKTTPKKTAKKTATKTVVKKVVTRRAAPKKTKEINGLPELLRDAALKILDERQAEDIVKIDLRGRSAVADYALIASGRSPRQLAAIADYLREAFFKLGVRRVRIEGLPQGDWVLIDGGDVLIHLFRPEVRSFYHLEDIWSAKKKP